MMNMTEDTIRGIRVEEPDESVFRAVKGNWDRIAKPIDGMGKFEEFHSRIGAIQENVYPDVADSAVLVFCADNGIAAEGVSQCGQEVTRTCAVNMGQGKTSVCAMAKAAGIRVIPIDIGIARPVASESSAGCRCGDLVKTGQAQEYKENGDAGDRAAKSEVQTDHIPGVINRKVAFGTRDFLKEPAMTEPEAMKAVETGIHLVQEMKERGFRILGIGELGIGNTTTSACVTSALLGCSPEIAVGRGAGLSDQGFLHKKDVVSEGLRKWKLTGGKGVERVKIDPLYVLQTVGGLDIAGMAGVCIGGAVYHVPIVLDGVISMTAALVAERLVPGIRKYLIPSHISREPAAKMIAEELELSPVLDADMALGEGTGAVMMMSLLKLADSVYRDCVPFEQSGVEAYHRFQ